MALPWLPIPAVIQQAAPDIRQEVVDPRLTVEWKTKTAYLNEKKVVFGGGVKATFGVTVVTAESLTLFYGEDAEHGVAEGNVLLVDPEGTIEASRMAFNWKNSTGSADRVVVKVALMTMEAQKLEVQPGRWELSNVKIMECGVKPAFYSMWSPSVVIEPRKRSIARRVEISILDRKVATIRRQEISLNRRNEGFRLPQVSLRRGAGLGVTWQSGVPLTNSTYTSFRYMAFPKRRPSASLNISRSLADPDQVQALLTPRSDLSEPFNYGYLENINVENPEDEAKTLSQKRLTLNLGSVVNVGVAGRTGRDSLSKPWDLMLEAGGVPGGFAQLHQLRLQELKVTGGERERRGVLISTVRTPDVRLGENLSGAIRGDARYFQGESGQAAWGRLSAELSFRASKAVRMGLGYSFGSNQGDFAFEFDRLESTRVVHGRVDFLLGPTRLNFLGKYDPRTREWFDFEFAAYQLAGCFEPFFVWRKSPSTSSFGLRLRVFEAFDRLKDELPRRTKDNRIVEEKPPPRIRIG